MGSQVEGHVTFVKSSGRVKGLAEMRVVLDDVITTDDMKTLLPPVEDMNAGPCAKTGGDEEGTIRVAARTRRTPSRMPPLELESAREAGATVGMGSMIDCNYYRRNRWRAGIWNQPCRRSRRGGGIDLNAYNLLKHEKQIILVQGTTMTFVINRSVDADTGNFWSGCASHRFQAIICDRGAPSTTTPRSESGHMFGLTNSERNHRCDAFIAFPSPSPPWLWSSAPLLQLLKTPLTCPLAPNCRSGSPPPSAQGH